MGFKVQRRIYRLVFEDPNLAGAIVRAKSIPFGEFLTIGRLASEIQDRGTQHAQELMDRMCITVSGALVDWNLEDEDGTPIPCTADGLLSLDPDLAMTIIRAWMDAMGSVPDPLGGPSSGGGNFPEASIPMETLSVNLPN